MQQNVVDVLFSIFGGTIRGVDYWFLDAVEVGVEGDVDCSRLNEHALEGAAKLS